MTFLKSQAEPDMERGLEFLLGHFKEPLWPRKISTHLTEDRQVLVGSKTDALSWLKQASRLDCRINSYPYREDWAYELLGQAPYFIFIDLDLEHFPSMLALNRALNRTLKKIRKSFSDKNIRPTVIWSGNGYHIYLPIQAFVLETESVFADLVKGSQCSRMFLQFAEQFLSGNKADKLHSRSLSFKNCMVRIPGSINSKNHEIVRVVQEWNGLRPAINWLLRDFRRYLIQEKFNTTYRRQKQERLRGNSYTSHINSHWIEALLEAPIADCRKYALWRVLAPYLANIRNLSYEESFSILSNYLKKCDLVRTLDFNADTRIRDSLKSADGYLPISFDGLKAEKRELHGFISNLMAKRSSHRWKSWHSV